MIIDPDYLLNREFPVVTESYTENDCILYALGVGMGMDPTDEQALRFVYEEDLKVMPSQPVVMAHPGFWASENDIGLDWVKILHLGQEMIFHKPLPTSGTVKATTRFTDIFDRGKRLGAQLNTERIVIDADTDEPLCSVITSVLARGDGGFGGERKATVKSDPIPGRDPDKLCDLATSPQQALLYRLSGDHNPLHVLPSIARDAGFKSPILHGLSTMGVMTHALLKSCCDYQPERFKHLRLRFSAPVYPGETIRTEIWEEDGHIAFRCKSVEQDKVVINNGYLLID